MSFNYSGDPSSSLKDQVRFIIQDTDCKEPLLQDAEIKFLLTSYNNSPIETAIRAIEIIMAKFARYVDESVGQVKISYSQRYTAYALMKEELRDRLSLETLTFYAGGISVSDKLTQEQNPDRVEPKFTIDIMKDDQFSSWNNGSLFGDYP